MGLKKDNLAYIYNLLKTTKKDRSWYKGMPLDAINMVPLVSHFLPEFKAFLIVSWRLQLSAWLHMWFIDVTIYPICGYVNENSDTFVHVEGNL